jgi:hypothetical protein|tara:strand:- start:1074 stop:1298 length:225 start_codon:yes stop_codon:yes gene_type:complete
MSKAIKLFETLLQYRERKAIMSDMMRAVHNYIIDEKTDMLENLLDNTVTVNNKTYIESKTILNEIKKLDDETID